MTQISQNYQSRINITAFPIKFSITGLNFRYLGNTTYAASKKQEIIADSTTEAELLASHKAYRKAKEFRNFAETIPILKPKNINFHEIDCQPLYRHYASINATQRTKHFDVKYLKVRNEFQNKNIQIQWIEREKNVADFFTHPTTYAEHEKRIRELGIYPPEELTEFFPGLEKYIGGIEK